MSGWIAYVVVVLAYPWGGAVEVKVSPETAIWACPSRTEITLSPAELTWSPTAGFGATSTIQVGQYGQQPLYCWR